MVKNLDRWLHSWLFRRRISVPHERHVFIAICDHYEPFHHGQKSLALDRVRRWQREHRKMVNEFRDSDGVPPRHTFFYPIEQWDNEVCGSIAELCRATGGEMEIHLHHEADTSANLARVLEEGKSQIANLGFLAQDPSGHLAFAFIHGNWALDHSHPEGRRCGVEDELAVLRRANCYADFTLPSAPSACQVPMINAMYYAREDGKPRSHARGTKLRAGVPHHPSKEELLLITGPLGLNWRRRKWGLLPRIENGDLTESNPPTPGRLRMWEKCLVHAEGRPEWIFIKLHTHGAIESNANMLLGEPMRAFHRHLRDKASGNSGFQYHYVSAREMTNLAHAVEAGETGEPSRFRDYYYKLNDGTAKVPMPEAKIAPPSTAPGFNYWPAL